jgi:DNA-binding winged helix-turn-helix (wHTH) protein
LLDTVWGYNSYPTTRTVDNQICKLRQKLELNPKSRSRFVTGHGIGYKFVHDEFESPMLAKVQGAQASLRRNTGREGDCDGAAIRSTILEHLSVTPKGAENCITYSCYFVTHDPCFQSNVLETISPCQWVTILRY